jgi:hypothetical protein
MAKNLKSTRFERVEKITSNLYYRQLTKQIELVRSSLSRSKYLNDETKKNSLEGTLASLIQTKDNYRTEFETAKFNDIILQSAEIIKKIEA